jgi:hypothetical protein
MEFSQLVNELLHSLNPTFVMSKSNSLCAILDGTFRFATY